MKTVIHCATLRFIHAINAIAVIGLLLSGIEIYRAAPFFSISFPSWITLGGDMKNAIRWHFLFMWVLFINTLSYVILRFFTRKHLVKVMPLSVKQLVVDTWKALRFKLAHHTDQYNAIQRWMYASIWLLLILMIISGIVLWKPVQFSTLTSLLGGYETARRVHFFGMTGIALFLIVHLPMAIAVPSTLASISFGLTEKDKGRPS